MSLVVNGLKLEEHFFEKEDFILSVLKNNIEKMLIEHYENKIYNYLRHFIYENESDIQNDSIDLKKYVDNKVFLYNQKIDTSNYPEKCSFKESLAYFDEIIKKDQSVFDCYTVKVCHNENENFKLIILPLSLDKELISEEVFKYSTFYASENQTDDIPDHFDNMEDKNKAIKDWYSINENDENKTKNFNVKINTINAIDALKKVKIKQLILKHRVRIQIYEDYFKKDDKEDVLDSLDNITLLLKDNDFINKYKKIYEFKVVILEKILYNLFLKK